MEEEGEPRALRVHWESLPCWPRGLVTAATQRSFIRGLTREMLTHCYAHQSGDRDANYLFTNRSFRSLSGRAPDSVCRRICSYQGKCPGEGGSALSDWAGPPHPERGPEQLHTLCWRLLLAPPHSFPPGSFRASPTSAHTCPHLILPLPISAHICPTPADTCPPPPHSYSHLSSVCILTPSASIGPCLRSPSGSLQPLCLSFSYHFWVLIAHMKANIVNSQEIKPHGIIS